MQGGGGGDVRDGKGFCSAPSTYFTVRFRFGKGWCRFGFGVYAPTHIVCVYLDMLLYRVTKTHRMPYL